LQKGRCIISYIKIPNLYRDTRILEFKRCWALEKIHGTSAHIRWKHGNELGFFSGGTKHETFVKLFDDADLSSLFEKHFGEENVVIYGESYGGKMQGMSETYGTRPVFVAFDVKIGGLWLAVPQAAEVAEAMGLEFVHYVECSTDLKALDEQRDRDSVQAFRNGMGEGHKAEGIVIRAPFECTLNNGARLIAKHKRDDFRETRTPRRVSGKQLKVLEDARAIAAEWVTEMRLTHVLDKLPNATGIEHTGDVVRAMVADVLCEGEGEFIETKAARKALGQAAAKMWKRRVTTIKTREA